MRGSLLRAEVASAALVKREVCQVLTEPDQEWSDQHVGPAFHATSSPVQFGQMFDGQLRGMHEQPQHTDSALLVCSQHTASDRFRVPCASPQIAGGQDGSPNARQHFRNKDLSRRRKQQASGHRIGLIGVLVDRLSPATTMSLAVLPIDPQQAIGNWRRPLDHQGRLSRDQCRKFREQSLIHSRGPRIEVQKPTTFRGTGRRISVSTMVREDIVTRGRRSKAGAVVKMSPEGLRQRHIHGVFRANSSQSVCADDSTTLPIGIMWHGCDESHSKSWLD